MITFSKLGRYGNIGNSMFQLAATLGIALKNNYDIKIPKSQTYFEPNNNCYNISLHDGFNINIPILTPEDQSNINNYYTEPHFNYDPNAFNIADNTDILGYFQTEKYFLHIKNEIKNTFKFKQDINDKAYQLFKQLNINPEETTSLHVRRGDYTYKQTHHCLQDLSYFEAAIKRASLKNILVFSDDIEWCRLNFLNTNTYFSTTNNAFVDLLAMSLCRNVITTNSTFSWWGAWLNNYDEKLIISPSRWFGPALANLNTTDIIPTNWVII